MNTHSQNSHSSSLFASPGNSSGQSPLPSGAQGGPRVRATFDPGWKFFKGDAPGAGQPGFGEEGWSSLDLPHDWGIEGPFSQAPGSETSGHLPTGIGWYRKHFNIPQTYSGKKVAIVFDGVYQNSEVWVNGQYVGKRPYGYIGFQYDLTPYLNFGGANLVAVRVDNSLQPNCRWYSGSGIYRHTWLLVTHPLHVAPSGTFVATPKVAAGSSQVEIKTRVQNESASAASCKLVTWVLDRDGSPLQSAEIVHEIPANGEHEFAQRMHMYQPVLWSLENPYLYRVHSRVLLEERVVDEYDTPFGIRKITFDADHGFLLNDQRVKLNGVCLHHDGGSVGAAVPERVWERRLELLKEMGCNAIRTSHNPYAPEFMDLCDRMGFLVMDEVFDEWKVAKAQTPDYGYRLYFDEWAERDTLDFIRRDRNHPSVVLWSAGNEVTDQIFPGGVETLRKLLEIFHREDPTRLVTVGCDQIVAEPAAVPRELLDLLDVVGYNYVDRWRERAELYYSLDRHAYPQARVIGTESPGMYGVRGDFRELFPPEPGEPARWWRSNRGTAVEQLWRFVRAYDYVAGDFMWTGIDHLGEAFWPARGSSTGVLDTCGFKKDGYYFYQSQWTSAPMLHLLPHWNWAGKEGDFIPVMCYTNCDTVELFLNGKSLGVQGYWFPREGMEQRYGTQPARAQAVRTTSDLHLTWTVPYQPGVLKAVGVRNGQVVATEEIATTGEPAALGVSVDRETIAADRRDVAHVAIAILDAQGRMVPVAGDEVHFEVQGEGRLIGVDNGNPLSHEDFQGRQIHAFNGLCLAIIQSTGKPGSIQVTARAAGLASSTVIVTAVA
jgi:beta-galactosidase